jgi:hypothetical protein
VLGLQDACADGRSICFGVVVCGYPFGCRILYHVHYVENKVKTAMKLETESAANFLIHLMQIKRGKVFLAQKAGEIAKGYCDKTAIEIPSEDTDSSPQQQRPTTAAESESEAAAAEI